MLGNIALVNCEKLLKIALKPYRLCACLHTFLNLYFFKFILGSSHKNRYKNYDLMSVI